MDPKKTRSPLRDKPLRNPGQSLQKEWEQIWENKIELYALVALVLIAFAAIEWWRVYTNMPPSPIIFTSAAGLATALAVWKFARHRPKLKSISQGIEGEKVVGQYLERLRTHGYQVFHDVMGPGFNVDHVLVGPAGVFTVETKTWSKPHQGDARITFEDGKLLAAGQLPDREPIVQARAQATWLRNFFSESTGKQLHVFPVVVFPGWFVEQPSPRLDGIWVLEPKALPSFIQNEPERLPATDVTLAAFHLSRFIRSGERDAR